MMFRMDHTKWVESKKIHRRSLLSFLNGAGGGGAYIAVLPVQRKGNRQI